MTAQFHVFIKYASKHFASSVMALEVKMCLDQTSSGDRSLFTQSNFISMRADEIKSIVNILFENTCTPSIGNWNKNNERKFRTFVKWETSLQCIAILFCRTLYEVKTEIFLVENFNQALLRSLSIPAITSHQYMLTTSLVGRLISIILTIHIRFV